MVRDEIKGVSGNGIRLSVLVVWCELEAHSHPVLTAHVPINSSISLEIHVFLHSANKLNET